MDRLVRSAVNKMCFSVKYFSIKFLQQFLFDRLFVMFTGTNFRACWSMRFVTVAIISVGESHWDVTGLIGSGSLFLWGFQLYIILVLSVNMVSLNFPYVRYFLIFSSWLLGSPFHNLVVCSFFSLSYVFSSFNSLRELLI